MKQKNTFKAVATFSSVFFFTLLATNRKKTCNTGQSDLRDLLQTPSNTYDAFGVFPSYKSDVRCMCINYPNRNI